MAGVTFTDWAGHRELLAGSPLQRLSAAEEACLEAPDTEVPAALSRAARALLGPAASSPAILSGNKFLLRDPALADPELNRRGLHVFRATFSRHVSRRVIAPVLLERGLVIHHGFFGDAEEVLVEARKVSQRRASKGDMNRLRGLPKLRKVWDRIREAVLDLYVRPSPETEDKLEEASFVQWITNRPGDGDRQKLVHCDTFFPSLKWWYFPEAVSEGAFVYAPESPVMTPGLADFLYRESCRVTEGRADEWRGKDHLEGSFRISSSELHALGLEARPVDVPADTLVIANTAGFHCRGEVRRPTERIALHGSIRTARPFEVPA